MSDIIGGVDSPSQFYVRSTRNQTWNFVSPRPPTDVYQQEVAYRCSGPMWRAHSSNQAHECLYEAVLLRHLTFHEESRNHLYHHHWQVVIKVGTDEFWMFVQGRNYKMKGSQCVGGYRLWRHKGRLRCCWTEICDRPVVFHQERILPLSSISLKSWYHGTDILYKPGAGRSSCVS